MCNGRKLNGTIQSLIPNLSKFNHLIPVTRSISGNLFVKINTKFFSIILPTNQHLKQIKIYNFPSNNITTHLNLDGDFELEGDTSSTSRPLQSMPFPGDCLAKREGVPVAVAAALLLWFNGVRGSIERMSVELGFL